MVLKSEIKAMTGLRGVATLMVTIYHVNPELRGPSVLGKIVGKGYLWVDLFFMLSGFVLTLNYAHRFATGWSIENWVDFLIRRIARVYPLYIVLVVAAITITCAGYGKTYVMPLLPQPVFQHPVTLGLANLLMIQSWGFGPSIGGTTWSLSAEWAAYLIFPLLVMLALFSRSRIALGIATLAAAGSIATALLTGVDGEIHSGALDAYDGTTCEPLLRCLSGFLLGVLAFRAAQSRRMPGWLSSDAATGAIAVLLVASLAANAHDLLILPFFPLLLLGLYRNRGRVGRLVGCRPVHWLGIISYSIYLVHPYLVLPKRELEGLAQAWLPAFGADLVASVASYAALLFASWTAFRFIEEPGRRCVNRLTNAWSMRCREPVGAAAAVTGDRGFERRVSGE